MNVLIFHLNYINSKTFKKKKLGLSNESQVFSEPVILQKIKKHMS